MLRIVPHSVPRVSRPCELFPDGSRRWSSNPSGKCSYDRPTRGAVRGTMRSMCGAGAGCLGIHNQSLCPPAGAGGAFSQTVRVGGSRLAFNFEGLGVLVAPDKRLVLRVQGLGFSVKA